MKIRINTEIIEALKPCVSRLVIWRENYKDFDGDILEFLELEKISAIDKIWVTIRVMPKFLVEAFAIDCAFSAYASSDASSDASSLRAASEVATYAATLYASKTQELENQVDALIMLIKAEGEL